MFYRIFILFRQFQRDGSATAAGQRDSFSSSYYFWQADTAVNGCYLLVGVVYSPCQKINTRFLHSQYHPRVEEYLPQQNLLDRED